ncbi:hypothetical protein Aperf_G00000113010 [Anoplocephala perfoliata]
MNSSQEDLFADNLKTIRPDCGDGSFGEVEISEPVSNFSVLYNISSLENDDVDADIDECLFAVTNSNFLAACYSAPDLGRQLVFYRLPALDHEQNNQLVSCTPHCSWLHVLSSGGYLLSLVFAHIKGRLICTPALFPCKPPRRRVNPFVGEIGLTTETSLTEITDLSMSRSAGEISEAFGWRPLEIKELFMLPGGQIGAVNMYTGSRSPLNDYICNYERSVVAKGDLSDSLSLLKSEVIFHRLYRALVDTLFTGTSSEQQLLDTTVRLKSLQDLPGYCSSHTNRSASALALDVQPSDVIASCDEWADFRNLPSSEFIRLVLAESSPVHSFVEVLRLLRDSLSIAVEVHPVSSASNLFHIYVDKWADSSSFNDVRHITYHLPDSLFKKESSFSIEVTVFLELACSAFIVPSPLRCKLHHRITTALDLLRLHDLSSTSLPLSLPVRLSPSADLMSKFEDLFKFYNFPLSKGGERSATFQYLAPSNPLVEVRLSVEESGFKIFSSNLAVLVQLYEAFQHHIREFIGQEGEVVSVDDLRREYAFLEIMQVSVYFPLHRSSLERKSFAAAKYRSLIESRNMGGCCLCSYYYSLKWSMLYLQMFLTLPGEPLASLLLERLLSPSVMSNGFNLSVLLSKVSVPGGERDSLSASLTNSNVVYLLLDLIHDILMSICSSTPVENPVDVSNQSFAINTTDPVEWKFTQLYHTFFLVRQLSVEDSRTTAFCFTSWFCENFSTSLVSQKEGYVGGVLATRRSLELFPNLLTRLLPFERNPVHLATQLGASSSFWTWSKGRSGSDEKEEKEGKCCLAWNVYIDMARGRLAELRMDNSLLTVPISGEMERDDDGAESPVNTTGWPPLVEDFMEVENCVNDVERLPSCLVEMHPFRSQFLRDTIMNFSVGHLRGTKDCI